MSALDYPRELLQIQVLDDAARGQAAAGRIQAAYQIADELARAPELIKEVIDK